MDYSAYLFYFIYIIRLYKYISLFLKKDDYMLFLFGNYYYYFSDGLNFKFH